jgi:hypothetical protein
VANQRSKPTPGQLTNWLLEKFSDELKYRCEKAAAHERVTLKEFVRKTLLKAVEKVEAEVVAEIMLNSAHESGQGPVRRSSPPDAGEAPKEKRKDKGKTKKG